MLDMGMDEGYVKYSSQRIDGSVASSASLDELNRARTALFDLGLIGVYSNGVGYGNVSQRALDNQFVITGTATGANRVLRADQFCLVESFSVERNSVQSRGTLHPSSESMTHGVIYAANPSVHGVIHIHSRSVFDDLLQRGALATGADIAYGTADMARAVAALVRAQSALPILFAMAGHDEGVVAYGADLPSVLALLTEMFHRSNNS